MNLCCILFNNPHNTRLKITTINTTPSVACTAQRHAKLRKQREIDNRRWVFKKRSICVQHTIEQPVYRGNTKHKTKSEKGKVKQDQIKSWKWLRRLTSVNLGEEKLVHEQNHWWQWCMCNSYRHMLMQTMCKYHKTETLLPCFGLIPLGVLVLISAFRWNFEIFVGCLIIGDP